VVRKRLHVALRNFFEKFVNRLARLLQSIDLSQREIRIGDEPTFCGYLVLNEVIFRSGASNARPAFPRGVHEVQIVWNQRDEVVDIDVANSILVSLSKNTKRMS
jgi:hypothetical protein